MIRFQRKLKYQLQGIVRVNKEGLCLFSKTRQKEEGGNWSLPHDSKGERETKLRLHRNSGSLWTAKCAGGRDKFVRLY